MGIKAWYVVFRSHSTARRVTVYISGDEESRSGDLCHVISNMISDFELVSIDPIYDKGVGDD